MNFPVCKENTQPDCENHSRDSVKEIIASEKNQNFDS